MKKLLSTLLLTIAGTATLLAQGSRVLTDTIYSEILASPRAYTVYLPPSFDQQPERKYPVLYLLHGLWGCNTDWTQHALLKPIADLLIRSGEAPEMVIVTPDADQGLGKEMQCGYFNMPGWAYEDFFFQEFIPEIERRYRGVGEKSSRAVAGLSMGGGGTAGYAQHHPEMFNSAYPMSALMSLPPDREVIDPQRSGDKYDVLNQSVRQNDHVRFVTEADDARKEAFRSVRWYVDCGDDDYLLGCNLDFYRAMREAGIPCELRVRDGVHDWAYWNSALYTLLPFAFKTN